MTNLSFLKPRFRAHLDTLSGPFRLDYKLRRMSSKPPSDHLLIHYEGAATPTSGKADQPSILNTHQGSCLGAYYAPVQSSALDSLTKSEQEATPLIVIAPGLGGHEGSGYAQWVAMEAASMGCASGILAPRGSGGSSPGFFHAGWFDDLIKICDHPRLSQFTRRYLIGFSMGGHIVVRLACAPEAKSVYQEVFACCPPIDLPCTAQYLDQGAWRIYKRHLLYRIKVVAQKLLDAIDHQDLQATDAQRESLRQSLKANMFSHFDQLAITQLLGYQDAKTYYQAESADRYLGDLHTPLCIALNRHDPFIPYQSQVDALRPYLDNNELLTLSSYHRGGHIFGGSWNDESAFGHCLRWIHSRSPSAS